MNIAGIIDLEALRKYTLALPNVVACEIYLAYCTEPGAVYIKEQMEKSNANRLLVAA